MNSQRFNLTFLDQIPPKAEATAKKPVDPGLNSSIEQPKLTDCFISSDVKFLKLLH